MKCTNRIFAFIISVMLSALLVACGPTNEEYTSYDVYNSTFEYGLTNNGSNSSIEFYAQDLCVTGMDDIGVSNVDSQIATAAGAFNITKGQVLYSQKMFEKVYPASTTKVLTCYVACLYGDLDSYVTVSANAVKQDKDSSVCNLKEGDIITLRDLLYGLMLRSGNDAAIAVAEGVSGDVGTFMSLMNQTAQSVGATNSHFVTPNGLHNEEHYTTVYDMYLILNTAMQNENFNTFFSATNYTTSYTSGGEAKTQEWKSTNQYISGNVATPSGFTIVGGKTGTTGAAGYCLVLLSENENHDKIVSFVFNADCRSNLYLLMNEILSQYCI